MSEALDAVTLRIERVGARGDGIAAYDGKPFYVPFTAPGDVVLARLGPAGRGTLVEVLEAGERQDPVCPHFGRCGGCALQHLNDTAYAATKESLVRDALAHRGLDAGVVEAVRRIPPGTRRRARLAIAISRKGDATIGFHERGTHRIVDMKFCAVLHPKLFALVEPLRMATHAHLRPGDEATAAMTLTEAGVDLVLELPREPDLPMLEALAELAGRHDLSRLTFRTGKDVPIPVAERRPPRVVFAGIMVDVPADSFLQASREAEQVMTECVLAGIGDASRIADLFSGLGTFSFALSGQAHVHAVDGAKSAIGALLASARRAGLAARITAEERDLGRRPLTSAELGRFDAAVFDPPYAGTEAQARQLAASQLQRIVGVSCNPATFARDARILADGGFRLVRVIPVDQFVWSAEIELVAWFERA